MPLYGMTSQGMRTPPPQRLARRVQRFQGGSALEECAVFERRKGQLLKARLAMPYQLQKCATWRHFQSFLRRQPNRPTEDNCSGDQVVNYLISADSRGKTIVHSMECERLLSPPCACPVRLAFKTVDSTIGRLRSAFNDLGREGRDNPAAARVVKTYLRDVTNEQLMVGLVPEQAVPVFSGKLRVVSLAILEALRGARGILRFSLLRTRAMLLIAMVSLQRGKQLGETRTTSIMRFPDNKGLLFFYKMLYWINWIVLLSLEPLVGELEYASVEWSAAGAWVGRVSNV